MHVRCLAHVFGKPHGELLGPQPEIQQNRSDQWTGIKSGLSDVQMYLSDEGNTRVAAENQDNTQKHTACQRAKYWGPFNKIEEVWLTI